MLRELTAKQRVFANLLANGYRQNHAWEAAGYRANRGGASRLAAHPVVVERVQAIQDARQIQQKRIDGELVSPKERKAAQTLLNIDFDTVQFAVNQLKLVNVWPLKQADRRWKKLFVLNRLGEYFLLECIPVNCDTYMEIQAQSAEALH